MIARIAIIVPVPEGFLHSLELVSASCCRMNTSPFVGGAEIRRFKNMPLPSTYGHFPYHSLHLPGHALR